MGIENVFEGNKVFIGKGRTGEVYKIDGNPEDLVMKLFSPNYFARLWNWFFFKSPHPLSTEVGHTHAYHKRIMGNGLSKFINGDVEIVDAVALTHNGFISPFIDGDTPTKEEMPLIYAKTQKLEQFFDDIGMPTLSFSPKHFSSRRKNFIVQSDRVYVVDYEQSVPIPDSRGNFGYDTIYFDDVGRFINDNKLQILDKLGTERTHRLDEAFELAKQYQIQLDMKPKWIGKIREKFSRSLSVRGIDTTVEKLYKEGKITEEELEDYRSGKSGKNIKLAAMNLGVHATIGFSTPPWIWTPYSAVARLAWTLANWGYYTAKSDEKRKIHNWRIMLVSSLPLPLPASVISNGAYLISIMEENPQIGLAIADNLVREFFGKDLEDVIQIIGSNSYSKPFVKAYESTYKSISNATYAGRLPEIFLGPNTKKAHDILLEYAMKGTRQN